MTDDLAVLMHDAVAGVVTRLPGGRLRFEYDPAYRAANGSTPLSFAMPLAFATHTDKVVTPWLWGLLPEDERVLARWSRQFHVSAASPFALLGTPVGEDCAGAVRFCSPESVDRLLDRSGDIEWLTETAVASRLRDLREDATNWLGIDFTGQFSLAGAQAKTALHHDGRRWGIPRGSTPTTHILKPAIRGFDDHEVNEHLCLEAARLAGLRVARTSIQRFGDESVIVVERYDRKATPDGLRRIHQEDMCQALAVHPRRKYQNEGGPSATQIIELLRKSMASRAAADAIDRFVDALIWNWLIAGTDAHAKNYSILLEKSEVRLAPLYDVASALPYGVHERRLKMAMKVGGDYDLFAVRRRWARAAVEWGLDSDRLASRTAELARLAPGAFSQAASSPEVVALERPSVGRLLTAVARRVERLRPQLG